MQSSGEISRGLVKTSAGYIHYRQAGCGQSIVLLNASGQASSVYLELMGELRSSYLVTAIDYPSHGMSDHVQEPTIADYAGWIVEVMDRLGIAKTALLAEATGNGVTLEIARTYPERVSKVVLVNCPFHLEKSSSVKAESEVMKTRPVDPAGFPLPRTIDFILEHDPAHSPMHPTQSWMDRINVCQAEAGRDRFQLLEAFPQYDLLKALAEVACPILLMMGEHFHYRKWIPEFEKRVKNLQWEIIPNGRFCAGWEFAGLIGERVGRFLQ